MSTKNRKTAGPPQHTDSPLLWSAKKVAFHCGLSVRSVWRAKSAQLLPPPVRIGSSVRWLAEDIRSWLLMRCPGQKEFLARRRAEQKR